METITPTHDITVVVARAAIIPLDASALPGISQPPTCFCAGVCARAGDLDKSDTALLVETMAWCGREGMVVLHPTVMRYAENSRRALQDKTV